MRNRNILLAAAWAGPRGITFTKNLTLDNPQPDPAPPPAAPGKTP